MKDLLVIAADKDAEFALKSLLLRIPGIEKLKEFSFDVITHQHRDPGVVNQGVEYARPHINQYRYLMLLFDYEGCGKEKNSREVIETSLEKSLCSNGWDDRCACVIFEPELESWLWVNKSHLHDIADWDNEQDVYEWIKTKGYKFKPETNKPVRPKEAFDSILKKQRIPHSSSLFAKFGMKAGYNECVDPSFTKFIEILKKWFPSE